MLIIVNNKTLSEYNVTKYKNKIVWFHRILSKRLCRPRLYLISIISKTMNDKIYYWYNKNFIALKYHLKVNCNNSQLLHISILTTMIL